MGWRGLIDAGNIRRRRSGVSCDFALDNLLTKK
jgi:hypothetical protein